MDLCDENISIFTEIEVSNFEELRRILWHAVEKGGHEEKRRKKFKREPLFTDTFLDNQASNSNISNVSIEKGGDYTVGTRHIQSFTSLSSFSSQDSQASQDQVSQEQDLEAAVSSSNSSTNPDSDFFNNNYDNFEQQYRKNGIATSVKNVLGSSIMDLRNIHTYHQKKRANKKTTYDSDSDSESELEDSIRRLADMDTTWFHGCGFKITLDTSIFFSQFTIALIGLIFCIIKLWSSDSCDITQTYAPIFTAILGYFFASPLKEFYKKNKSNNKK